MANPETIPHPKRANGRGIFSFAPRWMIIAGAVVLVIIVAVILSMFRTGDSADAAASEYAVQKMDLTISVLEGGNVISDKPDKFSCEVEGRTTIVDIVPDGYVVTPEDVANKKVLVQLDASSLSDRVTTQEISFQGTESSYKQAQVNYEIQLKQNESDIDASTLKVKFARMDFEKYLGEDLARKVLESPTGSQEVIAQVAALAEDPDAAADCPLGGGSLQTWRQLCSDIDLAAQSLAQAKSKYDWSLKLGPTDMVGPDGEHGKGYLSRTDVESDELSYNRALRDVDQKRLALKIFVQYDFPKQLAQLSSNYTEAGRELERVKARAEGQLARSLANLKGNEAQYQTQRSNLEKLRTQLANTQIVASRPGVVVYASSYDIGTRFRSPIMAGTSVQEKQLLIVMPDPQNMAVQVKVHEASVNKIVDALRNATPANPVRARIVLDAFPDNVLWGTVTRVADMPDAQNFMFSPDVKVYDTTVKIIDPPSYLKTGMSAKVEIYIAKLRDVVAVPVQTVTTLNGKRVCYLPGRDGEPVPRPVKTGQSNDSFIEITEGLAAGERVLLRPPEGGESEQPELEEPPALASETAPVPSSPAVSEPAALPPVAPAEPLSALADTSSLVIAPPANNPIGAAENGATGSRPSFNPSTMDIERVLARMPEDQREALRQQWNAATAEQRAELLRQWRPSGRPRRSRNTETQEEVTP